MKNSADCDTFCYARKTLSGKRMALVGFAEAAAAELARIVTGVDAFTRSLSIDADPSAELFKPFELILISLEAAAGTEWLRAESTSTIVDRSIALGPPAIVIALLTESPLPYREFCVWPSPPEVLLMRCVVALRSGARAAARLLPTGSTVVLADDDPSITALVRLTLQRNGLACEVASTGGSALELIQRLKPCAAVLDVGMPEMDGFEVLSRMKSVPELAQTRVILLTGCEQEADILRGFSLGADDYVIKPFNPMELMMRLKRAIGRI